MPTLAEARDVRLGGSNGAEQAPKLPPNVVTLPIIIAAIPKGDGGWRHVRIDAWLAPSDVGTAEDMENLKASIVQKVRDGLPGPRGFDALKSPHEGPQVAKNMLHAAAESSLGHPWTGDVLIRSLMAY